MTFFLIMIYLFAKFDAMCFSKFQVIKEKIFDFHPLIVVLTLNVGTQLLCVTHLLTMLYLSVKFLLICLSGFLVITQT